VPARLRIVFAGTPEFAVPCLAKLLQMPHQIVAVYSQPDRPAGRGRKLSPSPVKELAMQHELLVRTPESLRDTSAQAELSALAPDLMIVVAYGLILPKKVLAIPRFGCWNVHASLLPRWRGAAPIQRAVEAGDAQTGVCLMQMEAGLDTGPVYLRIRTDINENDTAAMLTDRLSQLGASMIEQGIELLLSNQLPAPDPQSIDGVEYAHKLDKAEALLRFDLPANVLERRVRAFLPFPVAQAEIAGEFVQIFAANAVAEQHDQAPGSVVRANKAGIDLACREGLLRVTELRRAGGKTIRAADYLNARPELKSRGSTAADKR
jgi:methionyl-tRNA formyltransferase